MVALIHWWTVSNMVYFITGSDVDIFVVWKLFLFCLLWYEREQLFLIISISQELLPLTWEFGCARYMLSVACSWVGLKKKMLKYYMKWSNLLKLSFCRLIKLPQWRSNTSASSTVIMQTWLAEVEKSLWLCSISITSGRHEWPFFCRRTAVEN